MTADYIPTLTTKPLHRVRARQRPHFEELDFTSDNSLEITDAALLDDPTIELRGYECSDGFDQTVMVHPDEIAHLLGHKGQVDPITTTLPPK